MQVRRRTRRRRKFAGAEENATSFALPVWQRPQPAQSVTFRCGRENGMRAEPGAQSPL
jgi:hypothetical protein